MGRLHSIWRSVVHGEIAVWPAPVVGVIVAVASIFIGKNRGDVNVDTALASMAAFLFGVLMAFTIVRTRERLVRVQDLVATGNASLFSIHQMMAVFGDQDRDHIRDLVDRHLTDQIDFRLVDYHAASDSFLRVTDAVYALNPQNRQEEAIYKELISLSLGMGDHRALIESSAGQAMSPLEWTGLLLLLILLLGLIAILPGGTVLGALVVGMLSGTLVTLMILLRKLDVLRWHERVTIWEPTTRLFRKMGQHPYVPRDVITSGRYRPSGLVRVVDYPDPYPLRATKIVTVENLSALDSNGAGGRASASNARVISPPEVPPAPG